MKDDLLAVHQLFPNASGHALFRNLQLNGIDNLDIDMLRIQDTYGTRGYSYDNEDIHAVVANNGAEDKELTTPTSSSSSSSSSKQSSTDLWTQASVWRSHESFAMGSLNFITGLMHFLEVKQDTKYICVRPRDYSCALYLYICIYISIAPCMECCNV
jgi:hypothetical protein